MNIHTYHTAGGKDLIRDFLDSLPVKEQAEGDLIIKNLEERGVTYINSLDTRQIQGKLWEIKFRRYNRLFYVLVDEDNIYLLHGCKKQKNKAETLDIKKAINRAKEII